ncbi:isoflavone reductase family protein [Mycena rosella]|uniref:Isoflavone reductase family protein n=1 Tax=Mycena rosella TaxID=1033263 RepID=A0AAD7DAV4_MYCRO|nr:isoflavone reductase family protein [Mycena rosella]
MTKQRVLLLGATGETGGSILNGLLADTESFVRHICHYPRGGSDRAVQDVEALVRPASINKPQVQELTKRGVKIRAVDIGGRLDDVVNSLAGVDVLISAIDAMGQLAQLSLATAAKQAGVKRFKEEVYQHIRRLYLPYTIIDVGFWHQLSFPTLPSGRVDYAAVVMNNKNEIPAEGTMPTILTDLRDIGPFVARIIKDPRTLNKL